MNKHGLKQLIKEEISKALLNEKLGVPTNIENVATQVFDEYVKYLKEEISIVEPFSLEITNNGMGFDIADLHIDTIEILIETNPSNDGDITLVGMAVPSSQIFTPDSGLRMLSPKDKSTFTEVPITIRVAIPDDTQGFELAEVMNNSRTSLIGSIAHELKHWYDSYKNVGGIKAGDRATYSMATTFPFGDIQPLNNFLYMLYFTSGIEASVRSSELASEMIAKGITKKEFYDFLTQSGLFKSLDNIRKWTYDGFKKELKGYIPQIKSLLKYAGTSVRGLNDDEVVDTMLEFTLINISNWTAQQLTNLVSSPTSFEDMILRAIGQKPSISDEDEKAFNKQINNIFKFNNNYDRYFQYSEKLFHRAANEGIKKISKIYGLLPDEEKLAESKILDRELWYKLYGRKVKLDTELKIPKLK